MAAIFFYLRRRDKSEIGAVVHPTDDLPRASFTDTPRYHRKVLLRVHGQVGVVTQYERNIERLGSGDCHKNYEARRRAMNDLRLETLHCLPYFTLLKVIGKTDFVVQWEAETLNSVDGKGSKLVWGRFNICLQIIKY